MQRLGQVGDKIEVRNGRSTIEGLPCRREIGIALWNLQQHGHQVLPHRMSFQLRGPFEGSDILAAKLESDVAIVWFEPLEPQLESIKVVEYESIIGTYPIRPVGVIDF